MTTSPQEAGSADSAKRPVFVDDTGRRLARVRVLVRAAIAVVGLYVVLVVVGLAGSVSLPALHLVDLGRPATPSTVVPRLGKGSGAAGLPAALGPPASSNGANRAGGANGAVPSG